jgi:hypothetical protein
MIAMPCESLYDYGKRGGFMVNRELIWLRPEAGAPARPKTCVSGRVFATSQIPIHMPRDTETTLIQATLRKSHGLKAASGRRGGPYG